jgi:hypothetical protein
LNHFTTVRPQNRYKIAIFGFWFYLSLSNILLSPDSQAIPWFFRNQSWHVGSSDLPLLSMPRSLESFHNSHWSLKCLAVSHGQPWMLDPWAITPCINNQPEPNQIGWSQMVVPHWHSQTLALFLHGFLYYWMAVSWGAVMAWWAGVTCQQQFTSLVLFLM